MKNERKNAEYGTGEDVERRHDWEREHAGRSRPHIAPCSCELHQALREALERNAKLEAELEEANEYGGRQLTEATLYLARAEKAFDKIRELEAELASQKMVFESVRVHDEGMRTNYLQARARAEKAEAELARAKDLRSRQPALIWKDRAEKAEARIAELEKQLWLFEKPAPATVGDETPSQGVQEREAD